MRRPCFRINFFPVQESVTVPLEGFDVDAETDFRFTPVVGAIFEVSNGKANSHHDFG